MTNLDLLIFILLNLLSISGIITSFILNKNKKSYLVLIIYQILNMLLSLSILSVFVIRNDIVTKIGIHFGLITIEEPIVIPNVEIYSDDNYKCEFNPTENTIVIYHKSDSNRMYSFYLTYLKDGLPQDLKIHSELDFDNEYITAIYGTYLFPKDNENVSKVKVYINKNDVYYLVEGNNLIIDTVFKKIVDKNTKFKKLFDLYGLKQNEKEKIFLDIVESYYILEENGIEIYNNKKLYDDVYICKNYASIDTKSKIGNILKHFNLTDSKEVSQYLAKEIRNQDSNSNVSKYRVYYYNNFKTIDFIEIIRKDNPDSIIIKEKDKKFSYDYLNYDKETYNYEEVKNKYYPEEAVNDEKKNEENEENEENEGKENKENKENKEIIAKTNEDDTNKTKSDKN